MMRPSLKHFGAGRIAKWIICALLSLGTVVLVFYTNQPHSTRSKPLTTELRTIFGNGFGAPNPLARIRLAFIGYSPSKILSYPNLNLRYSALNWNNSKEGKLRSGLNTVNGPTEPFHNVTEPLPRLPLWTTNGAPMVKPYRIPPILHQMYKNASIPDIYVPFVSSWLKNNPHLEYKLWTDSSMKLFMRDFYRSFMMKYLLYRYQLERVDVTRYFLLHHYGGVYADMDVESLKPLEPILQNYSCVLAKAPLELSRLLHDLDFHVCNAFMACRPGHPFFSLLINDIANFSQNNHQIEDVIYTTGPLALTQTLLKYKRMYAKRMLTDKEYEIFIAPPELFFPTFDDQFQLPKFRNMCSDFVPLTRRQRFACVWLMTNDYRKAPTVVSFTNHHWKHVGYSNGKYVGSTTDIRRVVPRVEEYRGLPQARTKG